MSNYEAELLISELMQSGRYDEAYPRLLPLADKESEFALVTLGWMHEYGASVEKDIELARSYYERATAHGSSEAYLRLGQLLTEAGKKVEARAILQKCAETGNLGCMNEFGSMLYDGEGGPADTAAGIEWLERAASQGHLFAQRKLLSITSRNSKSITTKVLIWLKIIGLGVKAGKESLRDRNSEKLE